MNKVAVYAIGRTSYWFEAVRKAAREDVSVKVIECVVAFPECLSLLPEPDVSALVLIEATFEPEPNRLVQALHRQGWKYVVVVAANPSWKQARQVFADAHAFDYWSQTYDPKQLRADLDYALRKMASSDDALVDLSHSGGGTMDLGQ